MSESLALKTVYGAIAQGVNVVMIIGDKSLTMDYDTAFNFSMLIRHAAQQAKGASGDVGFRIRGVATLTDGNLEAMKAQKSRDGTAVLVGRKPD